MAKCPRCLSRKGKRHCPALRTEICPQCCAEERLVSIPCPRDCSYLAGEIYQHRRRTERAKSLGKAFLESNAELFQSKPAQELSFNLRADIFYFSRQHGPIADNVLAEALEALIGQTSRVIVLTERLHPIVAFLQERFEDTGRYPLSKEFSVDHRKKALEKLVSHLRSLAQPRAAGSSTETFHHHTLIADFFGSLDFEADLDYSPDDAPHPEEESRGEKRTPGGLILPS